MWLLVRAFLLNFFACWTWSGMLYALRAVQPQKVIWLSAE